MTGRKAPIASPTVDAGDLAVNVKSFARSLRARNRSELTIKSYLEAANLFAAFLADRGMPLFVADITREHVEEFIIDQEAQHRASTAATRYRSLQQLFKWLDDEGEITGSPMAKMSLPKVTLEDVPILSKEQVKALLATCDGKTFTERRDQAILSVFCDTGARIAEVAALRWAPDDAESHDVDLDRGELRLLGKGAKWRVVGIGHTTARDIDRYVRMRSRHPSAHRSALWIGGKGAMTTSGIRQMVRTRGRLAGLPKLYPHMLRHAFAHHWLSDGGNEGDLMRLAGWSSDQMLRRYARTSAERRAIQAHKRLGLRDRL